MSDYVPIPCAFHERLEFAVLRRQRLRLRLKGSEAEAIMLPVDVATRDGAEWLTCLDEQGVSHVLRLDRLEGAEPA